MKQLTDAKQMLERVGKSFCSATFPALVNDLNRQWPMLREGFMQFLNLPFVLNNTGEPQTIVAYPDPEKFIAVSIRWAMCVGGIVALPAEANGWVGMVKGFRCADHLGRNREVKVTTFLLRGKPGQNYSINDQDIFAYFIDENDRRFVLTDPLDETGGGGGGGADAIYRAEGVLVGQRPALNFHAGTGIAITMGDDAGNTEVDVLIEATGSTTDLRPKYCRAQRQWEKNGGIYRVLVKALTGYGGTEVGDEFYVYIRCVAFDQDPNVKKHQDFLYEQDAEGTFITLDPSTLDAKIGSTRGFERAYEPVVEDGFCLNGWAPQDGVLNHADKGGSGKDWSTNDGNSPTEGSEWPPIYLMPTGETEEAPGNYLVQDPENSGAQLKHGHLIDIEAPPIAAAADDHEHHVHRMGFHCGTYNFCINPGGGMSTVLGYLLTQLADPHGSAGPAYTGPELAHEESHSSEHEPITLTHNVTAVMADIEGSTGLTYQTVWAKYVIILERVDNSYEVTNI